MSNLDGVEINRRGQALVADTLQTKSDERIFALGDCSDLVSADGKPLPSTAQVARQQALFLAKSFAGHIKSGAPLGHFKYRDMGSLVSLREYAAYGTLGSYGFLKGAAIKNPRSKLRGIGGRKEADQKNAASCGEYVPKEI